MQYFEEELAKTKVTMASLLLYLKQMQFFEEELAKTKAIMVSLLLY